MSTILDHPLQKLPDYDRPPSPPEEGETWRDSALCASVGGNVFFPEKGEPTRPAKSVCRRCPVTAECLAYALDIDARHGVWGGLSERERRRLRGWTGK